MPVALHTRVGQPSCDTHRKACAITEAFNCLDIVPSGKWAKSLTDKFAGMSLYTLVYNLIWKDGSLNWSRGTSLVCEGTLCDPGSAIALFDLELVERRKAQRLAKGGPQLLAILSPGGSRRRRDNDPQAKREATRVGLAQGQMLLKRALASKAHAPMLLAVLRSPGATAQESLLTAQRTTAKRRSPSTRATPQTSSMRSTWTQNSMGSWRRTSMSYWTPLPATLRTKRLAQTGRASWMVASPMLPQRRS